MGRNRISTTVSKPDSAPSSTRTLVDMATGENWAIIEDGKGKQQHVFPGGFTFVGLVYISKLRQVKLPADGYRLALLLMENAGYAGVSTKPFSELAEALGVWPSRISSLITRLEALGVVQKIGGRKSGNILINPTFCFRGRVAEQHKALEMWAAHRPFNLIKPATEQQARAS